MWYRNGSVAVTNGSATVVGAGTDFVANSSIGEVFLGPDGRVYEIGAILSATQLTIIPAYQGATAGGQAYGIQPTSSFARDLALAAGLLLNSFSTVRDGVGQGLFPDGSTAAPGMRFAADQDTGIRRSGANMMSFVVGGLDRLTISSNGLAMDVATSVAFSPADRFDYLGNSCANYGVTFGVNLGGGAPATVVAGYGAVIVATGSQERMRVTQSGAVGIGTSTPSYRLHVRHGEGSWEVVGLETTATATGCNISLRTAAQGFAWDMGLYGDSLGWGVRRSGTKLLSIDDSGNVLIGATSAAHHRTVKTATINTGQLLQSFGFDPSNPESCVEIYAAASGNTGSGAGAALKVNSDGVTGRSINSKGTINASGADYAEYVRKSLACGTIMKGDVCGIDSNGELTRTWADARRYVVKSTDPNLVGGDSWAAHLSSRPEAPLYAAPAYDGPAAPTKPVEPATFVPPVIELPVQPVRAEGEEDEAYLLRLAAFLNDRAATIAQAEAAAAAQVEAAKAQVAYAAAIDQHQAHLAAYRDAQAAYRTAVDAAEAAHAVALAQHGEALTAWEAQLEAARQTVDRIAFSGQVPVNVDADTLAACEAALGDGLAVYLVAVARGAGIGVTAVREADMTLQQYMRRLGAVWAIRDGCPWIDVQHG